MITDSEGINLIMAEAIVHVALQISFFAAADRYLIFLRLKMGNVC